MFTLVTQRMVVAAVQMIYGFSMRENLKGKELLGISQGDALGIHWDQKIVSDQLSKQILKQLLDHRQRENIGFQRVT